jgi:hypothetical protein
VSRQKRSPGAGDRGAKRTKLSVWPQIRRYICYRFYRSFKSGRSSASSRINATNHRFFLLLALLSERCFLYIAQAGLFVGGGYNLSNFFTAIYQ